MEMTETDYSEEMARMAIERQGLYGLLATVFREEMTTDLLGHLLNPDFQENLSAAGVDVEAFSKLEPGKTLLDNLDLEFSRLFMGPGKHVSPYESVHRGGDDGTLWGQETVALKNFIEQSGFTYDENYYGLPDHISVELEFMAHLSETEAECWRQNDPEKAANCQLFQKSFLNKHLGCWVGIFSDKVAELAEHPFYQQMALLTRNFVEIDQQELNQIDTSKVTLN